MTKLKTPNIYDVILEFNAGFKKDSCEDIWYVSNPQESFPKIAAICLTW